ncbi:hypothetical protein E2C01_020146 [Portunus trituberculatus]|uniref:Uncharacterized protein n=1 Tax=Portunus trituberculatus TaxID=210409 RepID=A0A5B7E2D4_PORTR|nr:hypothetical protein [Portunus trituberculatus]
MFTSRSRQLLLNSIHLFTLPPTARPPPRAASRPPREPITPPRASSRDAAKRNVAANLEGKVTYRD